MTRCAREPGVRRLMRLEPLFSLTDMSVGEGLSPEAARVALNRWKSQGMVRQAGPRVGLYYNLLRDPRAADEWLGDVAMLVHGSVIVIGPSVLHASSWTEQIPQVLTVAVPQARGYRQVDGIAVHGRSAEWFSTVSSCWRAAERGPYGLAALPPEWALADAIHHGDCLRDLRPDDIEIPARAGCAEKLLEALRAFDVPEDRYGPFMDSSGVQLPMDFARPRRA